MQSLSFLKPANKACCLAILRAGSKAKNTAYRQKHYCEGSAASSELARASPKVSTARLLAITRPTSARSTATRQSTVQAPRQLASWTTSLRPRCSTPEFLLALTCLLVQRHYFRNIGFQGGNARRGRRVSTHKLSRCTLTDLLHLAPQADRTIGVVARPRCQLNA